MGPRAVLFTLGFHAAAVGLGLWIHPGAGLAFWGVGICTPLAWLKITGRDEGGR